MVAFHSRVYTPQALLGWAVDIQSNDCSDLGFAQSKPTRTPKGPGGRCRTPIMRPDNDRMKSYDSTASKGVAQVDGSAPIEDRRPGPDGFEWVAPVATAIVQEDDIGIEIGGRGPADDAIASTEFVEVTI